MIMIINILPRSTFIITFFGFLVTSFYNLISYSLAPGHTFLSIQTLDFVTSLHGFSRVLGCTIHLLIDIINRHVLLVLISYKFCHKLVYSLFYSILHVLHLFQIAVIDVKILNNLHRGNGDLHLGETLHVNLLIHEACQRLHRFLGRVEDIHARS